MRTASVFGAAALLLTMAAASAAAELISGIEVGGKIGPYSTTKCGGIDDGVEVGKSLCYT
jgi:hypothetical protein